jgi:hypothetical protein
MCEKITLLTVTILVSVRCLHIAEIFLENASHVSGTTRRFKARQTSKRFCVAKDMLGERSGRPRRRWKIICTILWLDPLSHDGM